MHYIRFLKSPSLSQPYRDAVTLQLTTKITITSDLGESFLCFNLPLRVTLQDETGNQARTHLCQWKAGDRQLEISFPIMQNASSRRVKRPCRLIVQPQDASYRPDAFVHVLTEPIIQTMPAGSVLPVLSEEFSSLSRYNTSGRVQRRFNMADGGELCISEDTGESIARHIWLVHALRRTAQGRVVMVSAPISYYCASCSSRTSGYNIL